MVIQRRLIIYTNNEFVFAKKAIFGGVQHTWANTAAIKIKLDWV